MQEWYVHDKGATLGPFSTEQVKDSLAAGKIGAEATFCVSGTTTWRALGDLPELQPAKKTELPIAAGSACGACQCPVFRVVKKLVFLAVLASIAWVVWMKLGGHCCHHVHSF